MPFSGIWLMAYGSWLMAYAACITVQYQPFAMFPTTCRLMINTSMQCFARVREGRKAAKTNHVGSW